MPPDTESSYQTLLQTLFGTVRYTVPFVQSSDPPSATTWISYTGPFDIERLVQAINRLADVLEKSPPAKNPGTQPPDTKGEVR
jgi:hypothetical protein